MLYERSGSDADQPLNDDELLNAFVRDLGVIAQGLLDRPGDYVEPWQRKLAHWCREQADIIDDPAQSAEDVAQELIALALTERERPQMVEALRQDGPAFAAGRLRKHAERELLPEFDRRRAARNPHAQGVAIEKRFGGKPSVVMATPGMRGITRLVLTHRTADRRLVQRRRQLMQTLGHEGPSGLRGNQAGVKMLRRAVQHALADRPTLLRHYEAKRAACAPRGGHHEGYADPVVLPVAATRDHVTAEEARAIEDSQHGRKLGTPRARDARSRGLRRLESARVRGAVPITTPGEQDESSFLSPSVS